MEQATVGTSADFIDDVGLEIAVNSSGNIFALTYYVEARQLYSKNLFLCVCLPVSEKKVLKP